MIFMASKFSYFIRTLRVVFSVWKKVVDKTYWNATAKTNILGFALLVQHAKIGVISFLKVKNYKPVPYPFMLWNRFTGINAQKELEVLIKKTNKTRINSICTKLSFNSQVDMFIEYPLAINWCKLVWSIFLVKIRL